MGVTKIACIRSVGNMQVQTTGQCGTNELSHVLKISSLTKLTISVRIRIKLAGNTWLNSTLLEMFTGSTMNWAQDDRCAAELFAKNITYLAVPRASNRDDHPIVRPRRQITPQDLTILRIGGETESHDEKLWNGPRIKSPGPKEERYGLWLHETWCLGGELYC